MNGWKVLLFLLLSACKISTQTNKSEKSEKIDKIAFEKLGRELEKQPNSSGSFILFFQKTNPQKPTRLTKAIVIEIATGKIVLEENFVPGYIKWITETSVEVLTLPGMIRADQNLSDFKRTIQLTQPKPSL
jgi:hypothetical protein